MSQKNKQTNKPPLFSDIITDGVMKKLGRRSTRGEALSGIVPRSANDLVQEIAAEGWTHFTIVTIFVGKTKPKLSDMGMC